MIVQYRLHHFTLSRTDRTRCSAEVQEQATPLAPRPSYKQSFDELYRKGKSLTLHPPAGQLHGRSGRRSLLEDGERYLLRCIIMRPHHVPSRIYLMQNLLAQNRGREREVPRLAMQALDETSIKHCDCNTEHAKEAVEIVQLGLQAMKKAGREQGRVDDFLTDAIKHVPQLKGKLIEMVHHAHYNVHLPRLWEDDDSYDIMECT